MEITTEKQGDISIVSVNGRLTADCADEFKEKLNGVIAATPKVVLDLSLLEYIDSTGLGSIVFILQKDQEQGGDLKLAKLQGKPRIVFDITRAYKIFDIFDTVDQAVAALS